MSPQQRHPWSSYQPLKLILSLTYTASLVLRVPYYTTISLIPALRANKKWSAKQNFMTHMVYALLDNIARMGITTPLSLKPGKEGRRFQRVPVSTAPIYKGPLASQSTKPAEVGGTWFPDSPGADISSKTVVLYLHGGAFVQYDGRIQDCEPLSKYFLNKGTADAMFSLQYRLSGSGGFNPFPAALQDALSAYVFLLRELKIPAKQIVVAGDSAGGNLTIALLRYLSEFGSEIDVPLPKAAVVHSPWVDPSQTDVTGNPRYSTDLLPSNFLAWGYRSYTHGQNPRNPYIIPLGSPFAITVPIFASAATDEILYEYIVRWAEEMQGVSGNVVELYHEKDAVHDSYLAAHLTGFEESAWLVATEVAKFVKGLQVSPVELV